MRSVPATVRTITVPATGGGWLPVVRVSTVPPPQDALPLLEASQSRAVTAEEAARVISHFEQTRDDLLAEIKAAGA